jgi:hypothetical protein
MPRLDSAVVVSIFNANNTLAWSKSFAAKWESTAECASRDAGFLRQKAESLAKTHFPVREDYIATFGDMQAALRRAAPLDVGFPHKAAGFESVQMAKDMSCKVLHSVRLSDAASHLELYSGPLVLGYRVGGVARSLEVDAPALCCHYTSSGGQSIVLNSYTRPERKAETLLPAKHATPGEAAPAARARAGVPCEAVFSQHFIATQDATYKQARVRRVLAGRDINRSLPCHARFQSHRDARRLAKAEHDAVRRACGFSDAAWERSELSCTPRFSVWATPHVGAGVHVASVFLH